jgi:hypothetical protein
MGAEPIDQPLSGPQGTSGKNSRASWHCYQRRSARCPHQAAEVAGKKKKSRCQGRVRMIQEIARLLEFDKIIDRMKLFAHSPATLQLLEEITPLPSRPQIELRLAQIEETGDCSRRDSSLSNILLTSMA